MTDDHLDWVRAAHEAVAERARELTDAQLAEPSLLPGWSRAHVLAHIARNADGLRNLVSWAETGVETPMYESLASREADIEAGASQSPEALRADVVQADDALFAWLEAMDERAGVTVVRALHGDPFPARELPWVRAREAWVHLVDLDAGVTFGDVPPGVRDGLLDEAVQRSPGRDLAVGFVLQDEATSRRWLLGPQQPSAAVSGSQPDLLCWLTGRVPPGERPEPPPWP